MRIKKTPSWLRSLKHTLKTETNFNLSHDRKLTYLNIYRNDGLNCEFYPSRTFETIRESTDDRCTCDVCMYSSVDYNDGYKIKSAPNQSVYVTATYTINGRERDLDYLLPDEQDQFIDTIKKILKKKTA